MNLITVTERLNDLLFSHIQNQSSDTGPKKFVQTFESFYSGGNRKLGFFSEDGLTLTGVKKSIKV